MSMKSQPENGPGHDAPGIWKTCGLIMVKRTNRTPVAEPPFGVTVFSLPRSSGVNWPSAATWNVLPSADVSIRKSPVAALGESPHVFDGSTPKVEMSMAAGSLTTMNLGVFADGLPSGPRSDVEPQPTPCCWSIALIGPQPKAVKSGPLKAATLAPLSADAQSRTSRKLCRVAPALCAAIVCVITARSYPFANATTSW